jgi:hypothetical protein
VIAGCNWAKQVDEERVENGKKIEAAWSAVATSADNLATKKFLVAFASQHMAGPQAALGVRQMSEHIAAFTKEDYCPAVREFLSLSTRADFVKRSKTQCDENPPTATGLGGKQVELKNECRTVYATPCGQ